MRPGMTRYVLITLLLVLPVAAAPEDPSISFTKLWMYAYITEDQGSEIPVFDDKTNTVWVAGGRWSASTAGVHGTRVTSMCLDAVESVAALIAWAGPRHIAFSTTVIAPRVVDT
jgi:hypothetical protein